MITERTFKDEYFQVGDVLAPRDEYPNYANGIEIINTTEEDIIVRPVKSNVDLGNGKGCNITISKELITYKYRSIFPASKLNFDLNETNN